ncbi:MAG TPA: hypothetical protein VFZ53_01125 [Polyangiaceae bacterium]
MAERRKPRKRNAGPARESKRLSLLDLPPALEPRGEPPTNPAYAAPPPERATLLPAAAAPMEDVSLASLARAARRSSGPPEPLVTRRAPAEARAKTTLPPAEGSAELPPAVVAQARAAARQAAESTKLTAPEPAPLPRIVPFAHSVPPPAVHSIAPPPLRTEPSPPPNLASTLPPPVQMPSEPPRVHVARGGAWFRSLGVIVLSASVGALVSSALWGVKSELLDAKHREATSDENRTMNAASTGSCAPAGPAVNEPKTTLPLVQAAIATPSEAPRIAFDSLPLQSGKRREVTAERISLDAPAGESVSRAATETPRASRRASRESAPRSNRERRNAPPEPVPAALPEAPSRAAVTQAVERAASAATACDSGPNDGKVAVTFSPSGAVQSVSLVKGFGDASINGCVLRAFGRARVPAFSGEPVVVRKSLAW